MSEKEKLQLENECLLKYSKAQMIQKYIDEFEENCTLSDLWCKSKEEIERLNNIIDKKEQFLGDNIKRLEKEVVKRDNIINELEKWLKDYIKLFDKPDMLEEQTCEDLKEVLDKLQELKGSDSNE